MEFQEKLPYEALRNSKESQGNQNNVHKRQNTLEFFKGLEKNKKPLLHMPLAMPGV